MKWKQTHHDRLPAVCLIFNNGNRSHSCDGPRLSRYQLADVLGQHTHVLSFTQLFGIISSYFSPYSFQTALTQYI